MIQYLETFLKPREARAAIARLSNSTRGQSIEWIIAAAQLDEGPSPNLKLPDQRLIPLLIDLAGADLLADRELRRLIARNCDVDLLVRLHDYKSTVRGRRNPRSQADAVADRRWQPGRSWPSHFVSTLRLPAVFAGWRSEGALPDTLEVEPCVELNPLRDFQDDLHGQLLQVISGLDEHGNRAILTLPTGTNC